MTWARLRGLRLTGAWSRWILAALISPGLLTDPGIMRPILTAGRRDGNLFRPSLSLPSGLELKSALGHSRTISSSDVHAIKHP